jgi:tetratricopeptide (TPR) repeat protein
MKVSDSRQRALLFASAGVAALALVLATVYLVHRMEREREIGDVRAVVAEGIAQFRAEQYELSLETLGSIPEHLVTDWHIPYYQGSALVQLKEYRKGADYLESALALNPNEENVLFALGVVYFKLGNLALSKAYFAAVLDVNPGHEEAKGLMDVMASLERQQPGYDGQAQQPPDS